MKRFFTYSLSTIALILSVAAVSANVSETNLVIREYQAINSENASTPSEDNYFFTVFENSFVPMGTQRVFNARIPLVVTKAENNSYFSRNTCFSQLTNQKLYTTKSIYVSLNAEKEKDGYYIYTLRKLRI